MLGNNTDTSKLDDLITTTIDSINGFENSAEEKPDGRFASFFRDMAAERRQVVATLSEQSRSLGGTPTEQGSVAAALHRRWEDLRAALGGGDKAVIQELPQLMKRLDHTLGQLDKASTNANSLIAENRAPIANFTQNGLQQVGPTMGELRGLVKDLRQLVDRLDRNPGGHITGRTRPEEFDPKAKPAPKQ